jgi:hypothetical protein
VEYFPGSAVTWEVAMRRGRCGILFLLPRAGHRYKMVTVALAPQPENTISM